MCWSAGASVAMVGAGGAAMAFTFARGDQKAIWLTLGYFTLMEGLQAAGYAVVDECGTPANRSITLLSYLHIAFQPLVINAFCMALAPRPVSLRLRRAVYVAAGLATAALLVRLVPADAFGQCRAGDVLCGARLCLVSGSWHIGWELPLNDLPRQLGLPATFPAYLLGVFVLPLVYGAWRFVAFHALAGPMLAGILTGDPNEMPAIWCLFSIGIILIALIPRIRYGLMGAAGPARA
jgi:hypothetical protein